MEDLQNASKLLVKALKIRHKYMVNSHQAFPNVCREFLERLDGNDAKDHRIHENKATLEGNDDDEDYYSVKNNYLSILGIIFASHRIIFSLS